jgi:hypothetical protein
VPFLRVIRDKRGYETTYLMHWYREGNRQHSRILYVFRTPGGVRVGRDPLEPAVLRQIEQQHPDIAFDWKIVRDNQQVVDIAPEPRRRPPRQEETETPGAAPPPKVEPAPPARPSIPSKIEGDTPDDQIVFLSQLYPQVCARIEQRSHDPGRQEALMALAERLNPATWTDADQITTGLQQAAEALERLSHVFAKRRRRARKPAKGPAGETVAEGAAPPPDGPLEDAAGESDAADSADTNEGSTR